MVVLLKVGGVRLSDRDKGWLASKGSCGGIVIKHGFLLLVTAFLVLGTGISAVVVNEVELDPPGDDRNPKIVEWAELYNDGFEEVDISRWTLSSSAGEVRMPEGTVISSMGYYVAVLEGLNNANETLVLTSPEGLVVDTTPSLTDEANDDFSWTRNPDGRDTDRMDDWMYLPSTMGF